MVNFVEAIEDGRIVKVTEDYARREGLLIVRRQDNSAEYNPSSSLSGFGQKTAIGGTGSGISGVDKKRLIRRDFTMEKLRKPLHYYKNEVVADLIDNFHWEISRTRKLKNITRKQMAQAINENEETVKMIENGILPQDNYILINKVQSYLGVNLRREGKKFEAPKLEKRPEEPKPEVEVVDADAGEKLSGQEIEVFDD